MKLDAAGKRVVDSPEPSPVASEYETLRTAALGEPMAPECRSGLALFLRRGMWGWARALASVMEPERPTRSSATILTALHPRRAVVQVFAAMALSSNEERAR